MAPAFVYVLRRYVKAEFCTGQVVVIKSDRQLSPPEVRQALENLTHYPAEEFEEIRQQLDTSVLLDTWEQCPDVCHPADLDLNDAVRLYPVWWKEEMQTPTLLDPWVDREDGGAL